MQRALLVQTMLLPTCLQKWQLTEHLLLSHGEMSSPSSLMSGAVNGAREGCLQTEGRFQAHRALHK